MHSRFFFGYIPLIDRRLIKPTYYLPCGYVVESHGTCFYVDRHGTGTGCIW